MEGGGDRNRDGESKEIHEAQKQASHRYCTFNVYAHEKWICLSDALYALRALVLFRVRGLDVKVRFAL